MAINRYDKPAEAQFINTYVPIPFDEMMKIGLLKNARIEGSMADQSKMLADYNSFNVSPGKDEQTRDRIVEEIKADIGKIKGQPGSFEHQQGLMDINAKWAASPLVRNLKSNTGSWAEMSKAQQKAKVEKITDANTAEITNKMTEYYQLGAEGFQEKYGSGQLTPASYYGNVNIREDLKKWSDAVKPSSSEEEYIDKKTGLYKVNEKNAGITMTAAGRPYGLSFDTKYVNGKPTLDINEEAFRNDGFVKIMQTEAGAQLKRDAKYDLEKAGQPADEASIMERAYQVAKSHVKSIIGERITTDNSITFDADPYSLANHKKKLDDQVEVFTYDMNVDSITSKLTSVTSVNAAKQAASNNLKSVDDRMAQMSYEHNGVKEEVQTFTGKDGKPYTRTFYKGTDGQDVTEEYGQFNLEREQYQKQMEDLQGLEVKLKGQVGLSPDYTPKPETLKAAAAAGVAAMYKLYPAGSGSISPSSGTGNDAKLPETPEEQKAYDEAYDKTLQNLDPKWRDYNKALKENAKTEIINVGVSRFDSQQLNKAMETNGLIYFAENKKGELSGGIGGIKWAQQGDKGPWNNKNYEDIDNGKEPLLVGKLIDPIDGKVKLSYRFFSKEGTKENPIMMDAVLVDAPAGVAEHMMKNGEITFAEKTVSQWVSDNALGNDRETDLKLKTDKETGKPISVHIKKFNANERSRTPNNNQYRVDYPVTNSDKSVTIYPKYFATRQAMITDLIGYLQE
jgi:hypothetical protein